MSPWSFSVTSRPMGTTESFAPVTAGSRVEPRAHRRCWPSGPTTSPNCVPETVSIRTGASCLPRRLTNQALPTSQRHKANTGRPKGNTRTALPADYPGGEHPRLIEEHHIVGPHGEDEVEATDERGRRWYHLRPEPRIRYDLIGFNYVWWLIWILFIVIIFFPLGSGWGY